MKTKTKNQRAKKHKPNLNGPFSVEPNPKDSIEEVHTNGKKKEDGKTTGKTKEDDL